ncbi:MAG: lytic transglycosylase domain-containing protein [Clostridia bacterium]|nr:lytic transglycosylase domain-containing protein [Clostridia bacterium]
MKKLAKFLTIVLILSSIFFILLKIIKIDDIIMKKMYPLKYTEYIERYAEEYDIDPYMVYAIIKAESNFNEYAESGSGAIGLMQVMEATAMETAKKMELEITEKELFEPELNIRIGVKYFTDLLKKYENNYGISIVAYNAGIGNVDKWIETGVIKKDGTDLENVPFKETNNYVRKIVRDYEIYKKLYE